MGTLVTLTAITLATMTAVTQAMVLMGAEYLKCCRLTCIARGVIGLSLVVASVFFVYIRCTSRDQSAQHDNGGVWPLLFSSGCTSYELHSRSRTFAVHPEISRRSMTMAELTAAVLEHSMNVLDK